MTHNGTPSDRTRSAILSYANQSDLRRAHNFAATARPTSQLDLATTPTPWSQNYDQNTSHFDHEARHLPVSGRPIATLDLARQETITPNNVAETDFGFETRLVDEDPPFKAPESWHAVTDAEHSDQSWSFSQNWSWSERSTAAFLGFAAGILIVVPIVLMLSGTPDQQPTPAQETATKQILAQPESSPVVFANASVSAGAWFDTRDTKVNRPEAQPAHTIKVVSQAHQALTEGRVDQARTILRAAASPDTPQLWFMLAETYDPLVTTAQVPNEVLNSQQLRAADTNFARFYYQQALTHGVKEARLRLDDLTKR